MSMSTSEEPQVLNGYAIRYHDHGEGTAPHSTTELRVLYDLDEGEPKSTGRKTRHLGTAFWTDDGGHYVLGTMSQVFADFLAGAQIPFNTERPFDFDPDAEKVPIMGPDEDPTGPYWELFHSGEATEGQGEPTSAGNES